RGGDLVQPPRAAVDGDTGDVAGQRTGCGGGVNRRSCGDDACRQPGAGPRRGVDVDAGSGEIELRPAIGETRNDASLIDRTDCENGIEACRVVDVLSVVSRRCDDDDSGSLGAIERAPRIVEL